MASPALEVDLARSTPPPARPPAPNSSPPSPRRIHRKGGGLKCQLCGAALPSLDAYIAHRRSSACAAPPSTREAWRNPGSTTVARKSAAAAPAPKRLLPPAPAPAPAAASEAAGAATGVKRSLDFILRADERSPAAEPSSAGEEDDVPLSQLATPRAVEGRPRSLRRSQRRRQPRARQTLDDAQDDITARVAGAGSLVAAGADEDGAVPRAKKRVGALRLPLAGGEEEWEAVLALTELKSCEAEPPALGWPAGEGAKGAKGAVAPRAASPPPEAADMRLLTALAECGARSHSCPPTEEAAAPEPAPAAPASKEVPPAPASGEASDEAAAQAGEMPGLAPAPSADSSSLEVPGLLLGRPKRQALASSPLNSTSPAGTAADGVSSGGWGTHEPASEATSPSSTSPCSRSTPSTHTTGPPTPAPASPLLFPPAQQQPAGFEGRGGVSKSAHPGQPGTAGAAYSGFWNPHVAAGPAAPAAPGAGNSVAPGPPRGPHQAPLAVLRVPTGPHVAQAQDVRRQTPGNSAPQLLRMPTLLKVREACPSPAVASSSSARHDMTGFGSFTDMLIGAGHTADSDSDVTGGEGRIPHRGRDSGVAQAVGEKGVPPGDGMGMGNPWQGAGASPCASGVDDEAQGHSPRHPASPPTPGSTHPLSPFRTSQATLEPIPASQLAQRPQGVQEQQQWGTQGHAHSAWGHPAVRQHAQEPRAVQPGRAGPAAAAAAVSPLDALGLGSSAGDSAGLGALVQLPEFQALSRHWQALAQKLQQHMGKQGHPQQHQQQQQQQQGQQGQQQQQQHQQQQGQGQAWGGASAATALPDILQSTEYRELTSFLDGLVGQLRQHQQHQQYPQHQHQQQQYPQQQQQQQKYEQHHYQQHHHQQQMNHHQQQQQLLQYQQHQPQQPQYPACVPVPRQQEGGQHQLRHRAQQAPVFAPYPSSRGTGQDVINHGSCEALLVDAPVLCGQVPRAGRKVDLELHL